MATSASRRLVGAPVPGASARCVAARLAGVGVGVRSGVGLGLEPGDQRVGLVAGEATAGLTLVQAERAAGVAEVGVAGGADQLAQRLDLPAGRRRSRGLPERHRDESASRV